MKSKLDPRIFAELLNAFRLPDLFRTLGWDRSELAPQEVLVESSAHTLTTIAQKRGVVIFLCSPDASGKIPPRSVQLKIEKEATKLVYEHLLIFEDRAQSALTWLWVSRVPGEPTATRSHTWTKGTNPESLRQKLEHIVWSLEKEEAITLSDITTGLKRAFDRDKVTKRFYERFREEHRRFAGHIGGIEGETDTNLYASLMLNRLMFTYFIQRKGFLDGDTDYLSSRLQLVDETGDQYYQGFLMKLFHEGFGTSREQRNPGLTSLIGNIPYLNGGLFDEHTLEKDNPNIHIPDRAFENLFGFFDSYNWHLDDRPLKSSNEINPDVLGYIFEKYINLKQDDHQKEMGAYYTKEDITEYIGKSTIIPYILEEVAKNRPNAFVGNDSVWNLLVTDPRRYIYEDLLVGVLDANGNMVPNSDLPDYVQPSVTDPEAHNASKEYNYGEAIFYTTTGERGTLPTETWREYVDRRRRCRKHLENLGAGKVRSIESLVSLNLNLRQFMQDIIAYCEDPKLLRTIWQAIAGCGTQKLEDEPEHGLTVLDPTCGSGAFLFAALNILEPLYDACIDRMEEYLGPPDDCIDPAVKGFDSIVREVNTHPSRRYFIFKSIILRNLFGVDIMGEAVELCKLRLFLKLVSQVDYADQLEPLPDIDFNIRSGNALIGYATQEQFEKMTPLLDIDGKLRIQKKMSHLADVFGRFRENQLSSKNEQNAKIKAELQDGLIVLGRELDGHLARALGIKPETRDALEDWRRAAQPFHWLAEYYSVIRNGGFDIVIGNPPYVPNNSTSDYLNLGYRTANCPDIYALCLERAGAVCSINARSGMIVPLNLTFGKKFADLRNYVYSNFNQNWFSSFSKRPSLLFSGAQIRCVVHIGSRSGEKLSLTTKLHRWHAEMRQSLFSTISYSNFSPKAWGDLIPKLHGDALISAFETHLRSTFRIGSHFSKREQMHALYYKKSGGNWLSFGHFVPPAYNATNEEIENDGFGACYFYDDNIRKIAMCLLDGKFSFLYWNAIGNDWNVTKGNFETLPFDISSLETADASRLNSLADMLETRLSKSIVYMTMFRKTVGNFNLLNCRDITNMSDMIFARTFGFDHVWNEIELMYSHLVKPGVKEK